MIVTITDKFQVEVDSYNNHQPFYWKESELIEKGKYAGQMSKEGFQGSGKYFTNLAKAVYWGVSNGYVKDLPVPEGKISLSEYLQYLQELLDQTEKLLNNASVTS